MTDTSKIELTNDILKNKHRSKYERLMLTYEILSGAKYGETGSVRCQSRNSI
jgi:hypothetical protein